MLNKFLVTDIGEIQKLIRQGFFLLICLHLVPQVVGGHVGKDTVM